MQLGKHSRKLVELRKAFSLGTLTADGLLPIEGPILLEEAQRSRIEIVDVFIRSGSIVPKVPQVSANRLYELPREVFKTVHDTEHSQGILATVRPPQFQLPDIFTPVPALAVVLCRLQDPGNVGTILRVGEAFGATGCAALSESAGFYNSKVVRASAGSLFRLPHVGGIGLKETMDTLKAARVAIAGTAPASGKNVADWDWRGPTAVLIGNEGGGLNQEELSYCDALLRIPQNPEVESLNSAIATAVILYEASKQRRKRQ